MSRRQKIKHMTAEELKTKLYAHFQKSGSLDNLRAQLRGQLVSELFKVAEPMDSDAWPNAADIDKCLLPLQVSNWLILDHLTRQDYQYSLSTFVTEAHLPNPDKFLTAGDILVLLGLANKSTEFQNICKLYTENNELGCLHSLLLAIIKILFNLPNKKSVLNQNHNVNSERKLQENEIHQEELTPSFKQNKHQTLNDASVLNESAKSDKLGIGESFLSNDSVKSAEASFHEQLQSMKEKNEKDVQKLRLKLLEELDKLHAQERKMQLEVEFTKSELRKEQNKLLKEKEILKQKELLLEKELAHEFELKMRDVETEFASKLHFKEKEIEGLKIKVSEKEQKLIRTETELSTERDGQDIMKRELADLKHMYKIIQDKYSSVLEENTNLLKKFENMSDYSILKEELSTKSKEVIRLQQEIKDIYQQSEAERKKYVETVRSLENNLNMKEPQLFQAQKELEQVRSTFRTEEASWKKDNKKLEEELRKIKDRYDNMIDRMENQEETIQDLHRTCHTLHYKFTNNSNVMKEKPFVASKNFQTVAGTSSNRQQTVFTKRNTIPQQTLEKYENISLQFLNDARSRLGKLRQAEDLVQEKYSFIYGSLPENNRQAESYLNNSNLISIPKSNVDNYSFRTYSKSSSYLNFENISRHKVTSDLKSPYSLADVKKLVSHSLFSNKNKPPEDFQVNIGDFDHAPRFSNVINGEFKDMSKESKSYLDLQKKPLISRSLFDVSSRLSDGMPKAYSGNKNMSTNERKLSGIASPQRKLPGTASPDHSDSGEKSSNSYQFLQKSQVSSDVFDNKSENNSVSSTAHKNIVPLQTEEYGKTSEARELNFIIENEAQKSQEPLNLGNDCSQVTQKLVLDNSKSNTESTSGVFVNLDAAWKQMSSTLLSVSPKETLQTNQIVSNEHHESLFEPASTSKTDLNTKQEASNTNRNSFMESTNKTDNGSKAKPGSKLEVSSSVSNEEVAAQNKTSSLAMHTEGRQDTTMKSKGDSDASAELNLDYNNKSNDKTDIIDDNVPVAGDKKSDAKSVDKIESADTLSELSEIQLSCGSETEQQKEDSDAW